MRSVLDLLPMQLKRVENPKQTKITRVSLTVMEAGCLMQPESLAQPGCNQTMFTTPELTAPQVKYGRNFQATIRIRDQNLTAKVSTKIEG